ncbi:MAG: 4Fe-4S binding protein [Candidatus Gastranaerophilaceae bacterium]
MKKAKIGTAAVYVICALLTIAAFFAKDFVLYDFEMEPSNYRYTESDAERDFHAETSFWFSFGPDRELQYGFADNVSPDSIRLYARTENEFIPITAQDMNPIREDFIGYFAAALPAQFIDVDGDGTAETVYDFARADLGPHTYELEPREFNSSDFPFEVAFAERKVIQVFYHNELLTDRSVTVVSADGTAQTYYTDNNGWIDGLPIDVLRSGFTVSYSPDGQNVYRMYYAIEDYDYFSLHFFKAYLPLLVVLLLTAIGIVIVYVIRERYARRDPAYAIYSRERPGFRAANLNNKTSSKFLLIRWLFLIFGFLLWTYLGKVIAQGQALNQIAVPTFSCPFNLDQTLESSCYYLTHLPVLFTRGWTYIVWFLITLFLFLVLGGRILCGFMCPLGFVQDLFDKLRQALHIRPIPVSDKMNKAIQPLKWLWIILFLCFVFVGGDFCDICPNKVFSPALGGWWVNLALGGFLTIPLLVGSFFIKRFWCLMCPMGYLLGIFHKFNLFKLKKDCTACTECGACYEACPMRLKNIYKEREKADMQTVDCLMCGECIHKCPEDKALSMTFCGKTIYRSSRSTLLSKYAPKKKRKGGKSEEE